MKKGEEARPFKPEVKLPTDESANMDTVKEKKGKTVAAHLADVQKEKKPTEIAAPSAGPAEGAKSKPPPKETVNAYEVFHSAEGKEEEKPTMKGQSEGSVVAWKELPSTENFFSEKSAAKALQNKQKNAAGTGTGNAVSTN